MSAKRRVYAQTETNGLFLFAVSAALEDAEVSCSAAILIETDDPVPPPEHRRRLKASP